MTQRGRGRERLARNMDEQCIASIKVGKMLNYRCQLVEGHSGAHVNSLGKKWRRPVELLARTRKG
jgi:hypothetical protein